MRNWGTGAHRHWHIARRDELLTLVLEQVTAIWRCRLRTQVGGTRRSRTFRERFEFGLDVLLSGLEAMGARG